MQKIVYAKHKYNNRSPRKVRLVVNLVRGKNALESLDILKFTNKGASKDVYKVLASAIRNAVFNNEMDETSLVVAEAYVNEAPTYKRGRAVSRGRYHQILKRNCHIIIGVSETVEVSKSRVVKNAKKISKPSEKKDNVKKDTKKNKKVAAKKETTKKVSSKGVNNSKSKSK